MAEIVTERGKNDDITFHLSVSPAELDVVYRVLRCTKQNASNTRWGIAKRLRDIIETIYASKLDYDTDVRLSQDHFGMVTFQEMEL